MRNEGNFIAILRLLAKKHPILHGHLTSGAKYRNKIIQNEILGILLIRLGIFIEAVFTIVQIFLLQLMRLLHMVKKYYLFACIF